MAESESFRYGIAVTKVDIRVIAGASQNKIIKKDGLWKAYLNAPALDGKANKALIALLADYFEVCKSSIEITKGLKSQQKTISIKGI